MSTIGLACTRIFFIPIEEETARTHDLSIKGNNMKNKKMAVAGISLLGSIGVISTGFAGWIIGAPSQKGEGNGTITADGDVTTLGLETVSGKFGTGAALDEKIVFGANKASVNGGWLSADLKSDGSNTEDLTAEYTFVVKYTNVSSITVSEINFVETSNKYSPLADNGLTHGVVGALPTLKTATSKDSGYVTINNVEGSNKFKVDTDKKSATLAINKSGDPQTLTIKFSIGFAWGAAFEHNNPMDFYNASGKTKENDGAQASENIAKLKDLKGAGFKLTFTVSAQK